MAGLNAGTVLLLYKVNEENPNPKFIEVAQQSIHYLSNTLYDEETGSFLSFQAEDGIRDVERSRGLGRCV